MSQSAALDFGRFKVLTFDCYGTLIDWEAGILDGLRSMLPGGAAEATDDELLEAFAGAEATLEAGPWRPYREVLARAGQAVAARFGSRLDEPTAAGFGRSVVEWPAFADAALSLRRLAERYELGVITNCDDDLFAASNRLLGEPFRWVVTAEQVRSYKPARRHFEVALERIDAAPEHVLHVAQSLYHDHVPARELGLATAWIDRRAGRGGSGATPPATATPDLACPDMATFTVLALAS